MSDSTAIEQPAADSIGSDLAAAMAGYDEDFNEVAPATESTNETEETEEVEQPDEVEETEAVDESEEVEAKKPAIEAPSHWSLSDKETFAKAPPELQQWLLERHKSMEGDYTRKSQEVADIKKTWAPVQELFAPHMDTLRAQGQTPASVINHWASIDASLRQNPQQTLEWLAKQYNVSFGEPIDETFIDPHVQSLQQEIQQLKQSVLQRQQVESQQRLTTVQQELQSFSEQKTEAGELAHPYFEDVVEDMVTLAKAEQASGRTPKVGDLYEKAVWANPIVREKMLAAQHQAAAKKAELEARAKAAKAKTAKKTIRTSPDGEASSDLSLRDFLTQAFN